MVIFTLHFLGGSAREWELVERQLAGKVRVVSLDLPGFGDAAQTPGYSVAEMAAGVIRSIRAEAPDAWMIVGHSMGAKVAAAIARGIEDGAEHVPGFAGIVTLAGSPPSPEPMDAAQREKMLRWFAGDAHTSRAEARQFIGSNSGEKLETEWAERAADDVLRANRAAWVAWLESGSREDWTARIGVLQVPALIVAGADDEQLGPEAQAKLMLPHYAHARLVSLPDAKHLLPMECAADVARLICDHVDSVTRADRRIDRVRETFSALIASNRTSIGTRKALEARMHPDDPAYAPVAIDTAALATLRCVVDRVIPQGGLTDIDLAARIDAQLASGRGDGWRFAELPADARAYVIGLRTVEDLAQRAYGQDFVNLDDERKDALLKRIASGELGSAATDPSASAFSGAQMRLWFEDVRADAVKTYVAHPDTLALIGYSGSANGGDGAPKSGFANVGLGGRETWEPTALRDLVS